MTLFSVNVNKFALLRNSRGTDYPNLVESVTQILSLGVEGITIHPRPDQRHIKYEDAYQIADLIRNYHRNVELNIEGYPNEKFISLVQEIKPTQVTLVPDSDTQLTSDHGWNISRQINTLKNCSAAIRGFTERVCIFVDFDESNLNQIKQAEINGIEIYTGPYVSTEEPDVFLNQTAKLCQEARELGLRINAGHDLNQTNLMPFLERCDIDEVSIGHAFIVECIQSGMPETVKRYLELCRS